MLQYESQVSVCEKSFTKVFWRGNVISLIFSLGTASQTLDSNLLKSVNKVFSYVTAEILKPVSYPHQEGRQHPSAFSFHRECWLFAICCQDYDSI